MDLNDGTKWQAEFDDVPITDPARLLPAWVPTFPGREIMLRREQRVWAGGVPVAPLFLPRMDPAGLRVALSRGRREEVRRMERQDREAIPDDRPTYVFWYTGDTAHIVWSRYPDGMTLHVTNDRKHWRWRLLGREDALCLRDEIREAGAVACAVKLMAPYSGVEPWLRMPLEWARRAASRSTRRERPVPLAAETRTLQARCPVRYEGWRVIDRLFHGGLQALHALVKKALERAWRAWRWCPQILVINHAEIRGVTAFYHHLVNGQPGCEVSIGLDARIVGRVSHHAALAVLCHEISHAYEYASEIRPGVPMAPAALRDAVTHCQAATHGERFQNALAEIDRAGPGRLCRLDGPASRRLRFVYPAPPRPRRRKTAARHAPCRVSWAPGRGVVVWYRCPEGSRLRWEAAGSPRWKPLSTEIFSLGFKWAQLAWLAMHFPAADWRRVRVRQAGEHAVEVRTLRDLIAHAGTSPIIAMGGPEAAAQAWLARGLRETALAGDPAPPDIVLTWSSASHWTPGETSATPSPDGTFAQQAPP